MPPPSLHDNVLLSYTVRCEAREIALITTRRNDGTIEHRKTTFIGVEGYHFKNDAFGTIINNLEEVDLPLFFGKFGAEILQSFRAAGAPGPWAADIASGQKQLYEKGTRAFLISSSYGLSGWVLCSDVCVKSFDHIID